MATQPLIPPEVATDPRPSMGDPDVVDAMVRGMAHELSDALFAAPEGSNPQLAVHRLADKYGALFYAGNPDYQQTLTPEAQAVWLQDHNLGTAETDPRKVAGCLAVATLNDLVTAMLAQASGQIDDEQLQFRLDSAIEDCTSLLLGVENPAD